jgi:hypothetical protein
MEDKSQSNKEHVIKEYPDRTFWLEGKKLTGMGNLILTSKRLIFLNLVALEEWQIKEAQQLLKENDLNKIIQHTLKLHKKNFQIPLSSITRVRMEMYRIFPFPRLCMRIRYLINGNPIDIGFWFRIPYLMGLRQLEITQVMGWIYAVKNASEKEKPPFTLSK